MMLSTALWQSSGVLLITVRSACTFGETAKSSQDSKSSENALRVIAFPRSFILFSAGFFDSKALLIELTIVSLGHVAIGITAAGVDNCLVKIIGLDESTSVIGDGDGVCLKSTDCC